MKSRSIAPPAKTQQPCIASVESIQISLPPYVNWKQIHWKRIDACLAHNHLPDLQEVEIVIPWLIGFTRRTSWSMNDQLGIPWSVSERIGVPDADGDITQAIYDHFPRIQKQCALRITYREFRVEGNTSSFP